jgi:hypothetical protein
MGGCDLIRHGQLPAVDRSGRIRLRSHQTDMLSWPLDHDQVVLVGSRFIKTQPLDGDRVAQVAYPFGWEWI